MMRLAVIVPVLNEERAIADTLARLAPLRARGAVVIAVDGGSADRTAARARAAADHVLAAPREARTRGLVTLGMCGQFTAEMEPLCDHLISVPSKDTPVVQEVHIAAGHMLCHVVDHFLFESVMELGQGPA